MLDPEKVQKAIELLDDVIRLEEEKLKTLKHMRNCLVFRSRSWTVYEWNQYVAALSRN